MLVQVVVGMVRVAYGSSLRITSILLSEIGIMVGAESEAHFNTQALSKLAFSLAPGQRSKEKKKGISGHQGQCQYLRT